MAKKQHPNSLGIHKRKNLLRICKGIGIEGAAMMSNRDIVQAVADARTIEVGLNHKANADRIISWFELHEPDALAVALPKKWNRPPNKGKTKQDFYLSWEWRTLRMEVLKEHGFACQCCGARTTDTTMAGDHVRICVDHIKPLAKYWELRLERSNLQVLCDECNQGKGAWDETDHRAVDAVAAQRRHTT